MSTGLPADLPMAGASLGAGPGSTITVAAEEIGDELVHRCTVEFWPAGERQLVRGRLVALLQPLPEDVPRPPDLAEPTTLFIDLPGAPHTVAYPVPTTTPVTVTVDPA